MRRSVTGKKTAENTGNKMKAAFLAAAALAIAGVAFYFSTAVHAAKASGPGSVELKPAAQNALPSKSLSLPLFFEPNQGQTAPQVKFLARGAGYGLFLTADEAVLQLHPSAVSSQPVALSSPGASSSVIRMRLDGANSSARISGASPLPGKSMPRKHPPPVRRFRRNPCHCRYSSSPTRVRPLLRSSSSPAEPATACS